MFTVQFPTKPFGNKILLVVLPLLILLAAALSPAALAQVNEGDTTETVREVAEYFIRAGVEQYQRGQYIQAEKSFIRALDYEKYLSDATRDRLTALVDKAHQAVVARQLILKDIQMADKMIQQGQLLQAKSYLEKVKDSEFLSDAERKQVNEGLARLNSQLVKKQPAPVPAPPPRSEMPTLPPAQETGPRQAPVPDVTDAMSPTQAAPKYEPSGNGISAIEEGLLALERKRPAQQQIPEQLPPQQYTPQQYSPQQYTPQQYTPQQYAPQQYAPQQYVPEQYPPQQLPDPRVVSQPRAAGAGSYIEAVIQQRNVRRNYVHTLVADANDKVPHYISQGEFDKANQTVEAAQRVVNDFRIDLGENLYSQYSLILNKLADEIAQMQAAKKRMDKVGRDQAAEKAREEFRKRTEAARQKRIEDLMKNAWAYQQQQRYEEALGQLELLLALDPLHDEALRLKQTLDDTVTFRKQLEIRREVDRQRARILAETDESTTPYADELTYAKNWREIAAKRKPDEVIGQDPRDMAVYDQLDEIVNLSAWSPQMSFADAINELRNAVEPPLKIIVLWGDLLENAEIDQTTPINMDPVAAAPVGTVLELLLKSVSAGLVDLGHVVEGGVITIATVETLPSKLVTRVYDVTILLGRPAEFMGGGGGYGGGGYGGGGRYGGGGYGGGGYGGGGYGARCTRSLSSFPVVDDTVLSARWSASRGRAIRRR
ncbi:MAG: hypothetical protein ACYSUP_04275, partial [Planctomycetota bacterium]